jgi:hypothetical protein
MTYQVERYESNGNRLVLSEQFEYVAEGYTTTADQINEASEHPIRVRPDYAERQDGFLSSAPGCAYGLRLPSALSKGLYELRSGEQLRRVQKVPEFVLYLMPRRGEKKMVNVADWTAYWKEVNGY